MLFIFHTHTKAAPPIIPTSTSGILSGCGANDSKHFIRSDVRYMSLMHDANDGGQALFSCLKKVSMSFPLA